MTFLYKWYKIAPETLIKKEMTANTANHRNRFTQAEVYLQSLIDKSIHIKNQRDYGFFNDLKKQNPTKITIFSTTNGGQDKYSICLEIETILNKAGIKATRYMDNFVVNADEVEVPQAFIEKMQKEASMVGPQHKTENSFVSLALNNEYRVGLIYDLLLAYEVLVFAKKLDGDKVILSLPDQIEIDQASAILNSHQIEFELHDKYCLTAFRNESLEVDDVKNNMALPKTDWSRFGKNLDSAISIAVWECQKAGYSVSLPTKIGETKSSRVSLTFSKASESFVSKSVRSFKEKYGVEIEQPHAASDKHTFFVLYNGMNVKQDDSVVTKPQSAKIQLLKNIQKGHPVTEFLKSKGFNTKNPEKTDVPGFGLHVKEGLPEWIEITYGTEDQRKTLASEIYEALKGFVKHKNYKLKGLNKKGTSILFEENFRKGMDPITIALIKGGFETIDLKKPDRLGFSVRNLSGHKTITFSGGNETKRKIETEKALEFIKTKMPEYDFSSRDGSKYCFSGHLNPDTDNKAVEPKQDLAIVKPEASVVAEKLNVSQIAAQIGIKGWRKNRETKGIMCMSRGTVDAHGWQPVSLMLNDKSQKGINKIIAAKKAFTEALTNNGYYVKVNDPATKSFSLFKSTPERPVPEGFESKGSSPAAEVVLTPDVEKTKPDPLVDVIRKAMLSDLATNKDFQESVLEVLRTACPEAFSKGLTKDHVVNTYMSELKKFADEKVQDVFGKKVLLSEDLDGFSTEFLNKL